MNEQQFAYWLNGFAELNGDVPPTADQWKSIREHLATVFKKVTPNVGSPVVPNMRDDPSVKDMIEKARRANWIEPLRPAYNPYFLRGGFPHPPDTPIC